MKRAISLLVACSFAAPALAGPPVNDVAPEFDLDAPPILRGTTDDLGDHCPPAVDLETITGDNRLLGIGTGWGYHWVTGSGHSSAGSGPEFQRLYQFDMDWNLVETYPQSSTSPTWGGRDPAIIESENKLFVGAESSELQIFTFDPSTERMDVSLTETEFTSVFALIRALAYHPGRDTFFTKDFGGGIIEFDRDGFEVGFWSLASVSAYGAAYDPINDTIWFNAYCGSTCITAGVTQPGTILFEWDPNTGALTGREIDMQDLSYGPAGWVGWIPGGLDIFMNGDQVVFTVLNQASPRDFATLVLGDGTDGCPDGGGGCYPDCDDSGTLDFFDFLCFQNEFAAGTAYADCDGSGTHDFFDFLCFQNEFATGCP